MPEGPGNVEIAHHLHERGEEQPADASRRRRHRALEIFEAFLLAVVAVATAWSGYQAAKWDARSAERYAEASKYRVQTDQASTLGGQQRLYDISTFNSWLLARSSGQKGAAVLFERRFTPNYRVAFQAWLKTDPFNNPDAPAGPIFMPQYHPPFAEQIKELDAKASEAFAEGASSRETGDDYVRVTVFLATVLFIIAVSQRFDTSMVRTTLLGVAVVFLVGAVSLLATYPRI